MEGLPKTEESIRNLDMLDPTYELLRQHRAQTWLHTNYVFLNQEGRPIDVNTLRRRIWYPALKRAGIRVRTMYQTRHTFAMMMLATGENPEWVAKQLGHTSTQMLFQRYAKFIPNITRKDGAAFLGAYRGWFDEQQKVGADGLTADRGGIEHGPLGAVYDTFTTPQQKRG